MELGLRRQHALLSYRLFASKLCRVQIFFPGLCNETRSFNGVLIWVLIR